jgi:O-antigen ligase
VVALGLAIALALSPVAFGGVLPAWGLTLSGLLALALVVVGRDRDFEPQVLRIAAPLACLVALGLQATLQAVLPLAWGGSAAPEVAWRAAVLYWLAGLSAAVACRVGTSRRSRRVLLAGILCGVVFQLVYGAGNWLHEARSILGVAVESQPQRLKGTFVNPNHLATYLVCGLCALQAWGWWSWRQVARRERRDAAVWLVGIPALLWLSVTAALSLSGSRSGLLAAASGLTAQGVALAVLSRRSRTGWVLAAVLAVVVAVGAVVLDLGARPSSGMARLAATRVGDVSAGARVEAWQGAGRLWRQAPLWGHGAGSFEDAFVEVQPVSLAGTNWQHAHNDWLELLATQGLLGLGLLATAAAAAAKTFWRIAKRGHASEDRAAGYFGLGVLAALAMQEFVEFGMTRPANALAVAVLLGAAAGARLEARDAPPAVRAAP